MHTSPWKCSSPGSSVIKAEEGQGDYTYQKQVNHGAQPSPSPYITTWLNLQRLWGGGKGSEQRQRDTSPHSSLSPLSLLCTPILGYWKQLTLFFSTLHSLGSWDPALSWSSFYLSDTPQAPLWVSLHAGAPRFHLWTSSSRLLILEGFHANVLL